MSSPLRTEVENFRIDPALRALVQRAAELDALRILFDDATAQLTHMHALLTETCGTATQATEHARAVAASELEALRSESAHRLEALERTRGSLRTFLRHYLPRLRRHLLGR